MCCFLRCSINCAKDQLADSEDDDPLLNDNITRYQCTLSLPGIYKILCKIVHYLLHNKKAKKWQRIALYTLILVTFSGLLAIFLVFPLIFVNFPQMQRDLIFKPNHAISQLFRTTFPLGRTEADCSEKPDNFYVNVNSTRRIWLGVWHIQPYFRHDCAEAGDIPVLPLNDSSYPMVVYFHKGFGDRRYFLDKYFELRQLFHVVTFDYRNYGDSSWSEPDENDLVNDSIQLLKWVRNHTTSDIYIWGNELGAAVATHTVSRLINQNITITGLVLENVFTSLSDLLSNWYWPIGEMLSWFSLYRDTIACSLEENGLSFNTSKYVKTVNAPIMILSEFNSKIPYTVGRELAFVAAERDLTKQGTVTFNLVPVDRSKVIQLFIRDFVAECELFKNKNFKL